MEIRAEEIVRLNSGSPDLRVLRIAGNTATVEWSGHEGELHQSDFPLACLTAKNSN
jgi:hypothetical protein